MKKKKRENLLVLLKQTAIKQKKFIATFCCVAIFFALDAQSMLFDGSSVRLSYTQYTGVHGGSTPVVAQTDIAKYHNWAVTCDADLLQLGKGFSLGAHVGMTPTTYMVSSTSEIKKMMGFHYGVDLRCHILQLAGVQGKLGLSYRF